MNYKIKYTVKNGGGNVVKSGSIIVKNTADKIAAQIKLEAYLRKKHPSFYCLIVHDCEQHNPINDFFNGIFK